MQDKNSGTKSLNANKHVFMEQDVQTIIEEQAVGDFVIILNVRQKDTNTETQTGESGQGLLTTVSDS